MMKLYNLLALAALLLCCTCIDAKAVKAALCTSYADDVNLSYKDGIWRCDRLVCPKNAFGCKILLKNDVNQEDLLVRTNICYDENKTTLTSSQQTETISPVNMIDFDVESFIGARSVYSTSCSSYTQYVHGIFEVNDWPYVQQNMRDNLNVFFECKE